MIAIVNVGPCGKEHNYILRINADVIARFKHKRSDGLATCLRRAANAVKEAQSEKV